MPPYFTVHTVSSYLVALPEERHHLVKKCRDGITHVVFIHPAPIPLCILGNVFYM